MVLPSGLAWVEILHDSCVVVNATSIVSPPGFFDAAASGAPIARWCPCPAGFWCDAGATAESHASCTDTDDCAVGACPAGYKCYAGTAGDAGIGAVHAWPLSRGNRIEHTAAVPGGYLLGGRREQRRRLRSAAVARAAAAAGAACRRRACRRRTARDQRVAVVFFLLGCLVGSLTCGIGWRCASRAAGRLGAKETPRGYGGVATPRRGRTAKARQGVAGERRQQTLSHEEIARWRLEEAKLAGEVSEHILRRAPAAAPPVAAPVDDSIPEDDARLAA